MLSFFCLALPVSFEHSTKFGIEDDLLSPVSRMCCVSAVSQKMHFRKIFFLRNKKTTKGPW